MNAPELAERRIAGLVAELRAGAPAALAKTITLVENDGPWTAAILQAIAGDVGGAQVIGVTGPPGAGKSTLINAFIHELRRRGKTVAVAAVDPSSPVSGGAILGDRIRMTEHLGDAGVFVRSLSSRGHLGGLSAATARVVDVMDASGRDVVIVETVGAGQSEVEVADIADTKIVISAPGLGDAIQAIKSGILEIADILVVNKGDLPLADQTAAELLAMLELRVAAEWAVPVLTTEATTPRGIEALADAVERHRLDHVTDNTGRRRDPLGRARRLIAEAVARQVRTRLRHGSDAHLTALAEQVRRGEIAVDAAARRWLDGDSGACST